MTIDVKNAVGVVVITIDFIGDIDGRFQDEFVDVSGVGGSTSEIGRLEFNPPGDDVDNICGVGDGGYVCCKITRSFFVSGEDLKTFSFLRFNPSPAVFPYSGCPNIFTATVEYCGFDDFDDGSILI